MKTLNKKIFAVLLTTVFGLSSFSPALAASLSNPGDIVSSEVTVGKPTDVPGTTVIFVDPKLVKSGDMSPMGEIHEEYDHSEYVYRYSSITGYSIGPRNNDIFLISVARGMTKTLTREVQISGTLSFTTSFGVEIEKVIKLGLTSNLSGTMTYKFGTTDQYVGPDAPYNSRDYYGAINYDMYTCYIDRYDVYRVYNGPSMTGYDTYYVGQEAKSGVKVPKAVRYSVDSIQ